MDSFAWYDWVEIALLFLVTIVNFVRSGKSAKTVKEEFMKFRNSNYRVDLSDEQKDKEAQTFNPLLTQYKLNERTGLLEELPDKLDIRELIKSELHTCLEQSLSRLLPEDTDEDKDTLVLIDNASDDLDYLAQAFEVAEDYRERFNLDLSASFEDIFKRVQEYRDELSDKLSSKTIKEAFDDVQKKTPPAEKTE